MNKIEDSYNVVVFRDVSRSMCVLNTSHYFCVVYCCDAVRRHYVISYANINLYFKKVHFHQKHNTRDILSQITLKQLRAHFACAFWGHLSIYKLKHAFREIKIYEI